MGSTTTWLSHRSDYLEVLNVLWVQILSVIPESKVHDLSHQFNGRLSSIDFFSRHVEVIDKGNNLLSGILRIEFSCSLGVTSHDDVLCGLSSCSSREVDGHYYHFLIRKALKNCVNSFSLSYT